MIKNSFVWQDLSTFDTSRARKDYSALFGWSFAGDDGYDFGTLAGAQVAAVFPMPEKMVKIKMPSFWMSYVRVQDVAATVEQAKTYEGAIVEIEAQSFGQEGCVALIRDPAGAGLTVYEGPDISPPEAVVGCVCERYYHAPDVRVVEPFYRGLFGWRFQKAADERWPVYDVLDQDGSLVARAEEVPEAVRGKFRYWMPCFAVASSGRTIEVLERNGGQVSADLGDGRFTVSDAQGAHFMIRSANPESSIVGQENGDGRTRAEPTTWRAWLGLLCIWLAVYFDVQAFWGVLFLVWTWPTIRNARADFVDAVPRKEHPLLYWTLVSTWVVLSLWLILADLVDVLGRET